MTNTALFMPRLQHRKRMGNLFQWICIAMTLVCFLALVVLLTSIAVYGGKWLSLNFISHFPSRLFPEKSGLFSALMGSVWVISITAIVSVPIGVSAAVYLHEYAAKNWFTRLIELNIANLAGVPSIVYGLLGLAVFIRYFHLGRSVLAGAFTLSLLVLPVIIIVSREALAAVPDSIRQAAFGLGATRWQVVRAHVLPSAIPGISTGVILALSRAIGEAAPMVVISALTFITFVPSGPLDDFTVLPIQIYNWCDEPEVIYQELAAAGILVLLGILIPLNAMAVGIRFWFQRKT